MVYGAQTLSWSKWNDMKLGRRKTTGLFLTLIVLLGPKPGWAQEHSLECAKDQNIAAKTCSIASKSNENLLKAVADYCTKYADQKSQEELENAIYRFAASEDGGGLSKEHYKLQMNDLEERIIHLKKKISQVPAEERVAKEKRKKELKEKMKVLSQAILESDNEGQTSKISPEYDLLSNEFFKLGGYEDENYEAALEDVVAQLTTFKNIYKKMVTEDAGEDPKMAIGKIVITETAAQFKLKAKYKDCGLTDVEIFSIAFYSYTGSSAINTALRSNAPDRLTGVAALIIAINSGLKKLAPYEGQVKRGADLPKEILADHIPGNVVTYKAFTSSSTGGGFGASSRFIIEGKTGRYIAPLSHSPQEEEVLFPNGAKFKILSRQRANSFITNITMVEVD